MSAPHLDQQFLNLYQQHHLWIYHWLYKKLGNSSDAADLAQDTFIRVFAKKQILELQQPRAYLTKIAKGLMINWIQRKQIERAYLEVLAEQPEYHHPSPEHNLMIIEALTEIFYLLSELPDVVQQAFLFAQLEGKKHQQIAEELNISVSTVKRYIQQGYLQCLTVMLDDEDDIHS
ncbi:sigma-70 family RNA polymerase sigma factor [Acinetobacter qingfengensis]|uniref:RNA polymerase subunit sigma n=1 Tax=Acinetobacter qingfengensis TaxID=1262585 RepID=A0A1E7RDM3_9GAMM|nr:sigma-70 family RNA polymerase sigma factor [Acinetobacter qingfengensis]KAA8732356.1 sigma-70 family RNA polymerase sigma factor [Acinetobacter qingfengensis]OEY97265.1 RNA polymerase subunit sigma [Acinetobacter qingfengensis]